MTKAELLAVPVVGQLFTWAGGFPIRRGESDRDGIRTARELVREGRVVGVFAEGTRQRLGYPGPIYPGAVMIAMQEADPVVPVGIESFGWSLGNRRRCCVVFGEPVCFDDLPRNGRGYREASRALEGEILRLWRQAAEAVAAGFPAVLPDGTRRSEWVRPGEGVRTVAAPRLSA
jgi:1-acyl-sn-glycerol-3-phosphate acyltransferase